MGPLLAVLMLVASGEPAAADESRGLRPPSRPRPAPRQVHHGATLAVSEVPRLEPPPAPQDYLDAFTLVSGAGASGNFLSWTWSDLEPSPSVYALDQVRDRIAFYGEQHGRSLLVGIQVLNTTAKETPADLRGLRFSEPLVRQRFRALLDAFLPLLSNDVAYLSLGNEVDVYLHYYPEEQEAYRCFYDEALAYVHAAAPWLRVGVTATFRGATVFDRQFLASLNTHSDVLILTYYPFADRFVPPTPDSPLADFPRMVELAGERPVVLQGVGYPSSADLGSSEEAQAAFVTSVFEAWAAQGSRISFLNFFALHDFTPSLCDELARYYGGENDAALKAYLCSLGLRSVEGTPKPAWESFAAAAPLPATF